ncbi:MAG: aldehyde dehydrogenase family protein, partial [Gammaproteobacteria bacterium]
MSERYGHFIAGARHEGRTGRSGDVFNPSTGEVKAQVAFAGPEEVDAAVQSALAAQADWAAVNPQRRARVLFRFKSLVEADADNLARLLSEEHGKVIAD